jgi:hypothetical protein
MPSFTFSETTLYWLAGLLEGEGSFLAPAPSAPNQPRISINMTDEDVIRRAADVFGIRVVHCRRSQNEKWKPSYLVQIRGRKAVELMQMLRPLMGNRRQQQIDKALAAYQGVRRSKLNLSDATVLDIYRRAHSGEPYRRIAADHSVSFQTVADIKLGRTWSHLTAGVLL